ncbi:hypothetical protein NDU88_004111 [Pleurodeles waltl]|uniref:Uncharacterized protein n=1 Tax=Pleurodeles waltl TaxID=8319 RepID=A0AAV7T6W1_PLEWA|nr:hypothetical protein NDU88_004111 [Pleurodeles waltl]
MSPRSAEPCSAPIAGTQGPVYRSSDLVHGPRAAAIFSGRLSAVPNQDHCPARATPRRRESGPALTLRVGSKPRSSAVPGLSCTVAFPGSVPGLCSLWVGPAFGPGREPPRSRSQALGSVVPRMLYGAVGSDGLQCEAATSGRGPGLSSGRRLPRRESKASQSG